MVSWMGCSGPSNGTVLQTPSHPTMTPLGSTNGTVLQTPSGNGNPTMSPLGSTNPTNMPVASPTTSSSQKTVLYQLGDKNAQMMSYLIYTKEGKLIILDGGYTHNCQDIIKLAKELTGKTVPIVDAWLFSHPHEDHVDAFSEFMKLENAMQVKGVYYNFPSATYIQKYAQGAYGTYTKFMAALDNFSGQITTVQVGDTISVGSVEIEVLLTPDESVTENIINESSVVYRMRIENQTVLFLGDLGTESGKRLRKTYGTQLVSDIVQMAHHGSNGIPYPMYSVISPKICLWPTPDWLWRNDNGGGTNSGSWETITVYEYMRDKLGVQVHLVARDEIQKLEFPVNL